MLLIILFSIPGAIAANHNFEMTVKDNIEAHYGDKSLNIVKDSFSSSIIKSYGGLLKLTIINNTRINNISYKIINKVTVEKLALNINQTSIVKSCNYVFNRTENIQIQSGYYRIIYNASVIINGNLTHGLIHGNNLLNVKLPEDNFYYYFIPAMSIPAILSGIMSYKLYKKMK